MPRQLRATRGVVLDQRTSVGHGIRNFILYQHHRLTERRDLRYGSPAFRQTARGEQADAVALNALEQGDRSQRVDRRALQNDRVSRRVQHVVEPGQHGRRKRVGQVVGARVHHDDTDGHAPVGTQLARIGMRPVIEPLAGSQHTCRHFRADLAAAPVDNVGDRHGRSAGQVGHIAQRSRGRGSYTLGTTGGAGHHQCDSRGTSLPEPPSRKSRSTP